MFRSSRTCAVFLAAPLALLACTGQDGEEAAPPDNANEVEHTQQPPLSEAPPMVVSSPAYRCDDGRALYVDVMSDENFVNVRDSRQDIPVRLDRNPETQAYEGQGRSLSGTGEEVRYAAPDRPDQACRVAAE